MAAAIWYKDVRGFFGAENLTNILPIRDMSVEEQLNALVRFTIYFTGIVTLIRRDARMVPVLLAVMIFSAMAYRVVAYKRQTELFGIRAARKGAPLAVDPATKKVCQRPTRDNPFMNVLISDIAANPDRRPACPDSVAVREGIDGHFSNNLYRDVADIFNRNTSDRQWVTNPSTTIPNDQKGFAEWLYGDMKGKQP
jgi:hypothetical protein